LLLGSWTLAARRQIRAPTPTPSEIRSTFNSQPNLRPFNQNAMQTPRGLDLDLDLSISIRRRRRAGTPRRCCRCPPACFLSLPTYSPPARLVFDWPLDACDRPGMVAGSIDSIDGEGIDRLMRLAGQRSASIDLDPSSSSPSTGNGPRALNRVTQTQPTTREAPRRLGLRFAACPLSRFLSCLASRPLRARLDPTQQPLDRSDSLREPIAAGLLGACNRLRAPLPTAPMLLGFFLFDAGRRPTRHRPCLA
jgi:hypothetical protein